MLLKEVLVIGNGIARIADGTYQHDLQAAVLGKRLHLQVSDADHDLTPQADRLEATVQVYSRKTPDEIDEEIAERVATGELEEAPEDGTLKDLIDPLKLVRSLPVQLRESAENGVFRLAVPLHPGSGVPDALHADPGQVVRLVYLDKRHLGEDWGGADRPVHGRASMDDPAAV